jgi:hypothetical protein
VAPDNDSMVVRWVMVWAFQKSSRRVNTRKHPPPGQ